MKKIFCDHCGKEINDKEENIYDIKLSVECIFPSKRKDFIDDNFYREEVCEKCYSYFQEIDALARILPPKHSSDF